MSKIREREAKWVVEGRNSKDDEWRFIAGYEEEYEAEAHYNDVSKWRFVRCSPTGGPGEPESKPWEFARYGEVWLVEWEGTESACIVVRKDIAKGGLAFDDGVRATPAIQAPIITAGRRIFPEVQS